MLCLSLGNVFDGVPLEQGPGHSGPGREALKGKPEAGLGLPALADQGLCSRGERWTLPEADSALHVLQAPETLGERRLGDPQGVPQDGEET